MFKAFRKYLDMDHPEPTQNHKLKTLAGLLHRLVLFLGEEPGKNAPKPLSEIPRAEQYIQRIVFPYITKLRSEKSKKAAVAPRTPYSGEAYGAGFDSGLMNFGFESDLGMTEGSGMDANAETGPSQQMMSLVETL